MGHDYQQLVNQVDDYITKKDIINMHYYFSYFWMILIINHKLNYLIKQYATIFNNYTTNYNLLTIMYPHLYINTHNIQKISPFTKEAA